MEYSELGSLADVEADLALSDDEDDSDKHWPQMALHTKHSGPTLYSPVPSDPWTRLLIQVNHHLLLLSHQSSQKNHVPRLPLPLPQL